MPEVLIITPESLHLLLAQKNYPEYFRSLKIIAVDEWHELLGSKRGVQVELSISRLVALNKLQPASHKLQLWGISATIGNLDQAREVLLSSISQEGIIITADIKKKIEISMGRAHRYQTGA
jgi:ATP-dependent Lhr-like helicase